MEQKIQTTREEKLTESFKSECPFCSKELEQAYEKQLVHNMKIHMLNCKENPDNE